MKNILFILIVVVLAFYVGFTTYRPVNDRMSFAYRQEFVTGCMEAGTGYAYCSCAFDYLDSNYTNDELLEMSLKVVNDQIPDEIYEAALECYDLAQ